MEQRLESQWATRRSGMPLSGRRPRLDGRNLLQPCFKECQRPAKIILLRCTRTAGRLALNDHPASSRETLHTDPQSDAGIRATLERPGGNPMRKLSRHELVARCDVPVADSGGHIDGKDLVDDPITAAASQIDGDNSCVL